MDKKITISQNYADYFKLRYHDGHALVHDLNTKKSLEFEYQDIFAARNTLLKKDCHEYVFIGRNIFHFDHVHEITHFKCLEGPNNVHYCYAKDETGNFLCLDDEHVFVIPEHVVDTGKEFHDDKIYFPYQEDDHDSFESNMISFHEKAKKIHGFRDITELWTGERKFHWTFHVDYEEQFDRMSYFFKEIYIVQRGEKKRIKREEYNSLMKEFNDKYLNTENLDIDPIIMNQTFRFKNKN